MKETMRKFNEWKASLQDGDITPMDYEVPIEYWEQKYSARKQQLNLGIAVNTIHLARVKGATAEELDRLYRYMWVLLDGVKHHTDWERAYVDFRIEELEEKYS